MARWLGSSLLPGRNAPPHFPPSESRMASVSRRSRDSRDGCVNARPIRPTGTSHRRPAWRVGRVMDQRQLLEISPLQADEGELIGKHPRDLPSKILTQKFRAQNPLKAIREKCLDCCCGNAVEVRKCTATDCALWPYRMGTNPFRKKHELTPAQKRERADRLVKSSTF